MAINIYLFYLSHSRCESILVRTMCGDACFHSFITLLTVFMTVTLFSFLYSSHCSTGPMSELARYLDPPASSGRSPSASCSWCSCLVSGSGTSRNRWSWFRPSPATAAEQKLAPGASLPWPVQSPAPNERGESRARNRRGVWNDASVTGSEEKEWNEAPTSKHSSSFIPCCHFSNSLSQFRTVLRGQTTSAVLNSSFSHSSNVWRKVTT